MTVNCEVLQLALGTLRQRWWRNTWLDLPGIALSELALRKKLEEQPIQGQFSFDCSCTHCRTIREREMKAL